jgi:hypothetical protein
MLQSHLWPKPVDFNEFQSLLSIRCEFSGDFYFAFFSLLGNDFWEVDSLGNSLLKGMNSGAPGKNFRRGSGTLSPYRARLASGADIVGLVLTYLLGLVVLKNAAHRSRCGTECRIERVNVRLLRISLLLRAETDLQSARLVVCAV